MQQNDSLADGYFFPASTAVHQPRVGRAIGETVILTTPPCLSLLKHLLNLQGDQMTVSSMARWDGLYARFVIKISRRCCMHPQLHVLTKHV